MKVAEPIKIERRSWPLYAINDNTGKAAPEIIGIYKYFNELGYCATVENGQYELYKIEKPFIDTIQETHLHKEIKEYFENHPEADNFDDTIVVGVREPREVHINKNTILENITKYGLGKIVKHENHVYLKNEKISYQRHTRDKAFFYFRNCWVEITKDRIIKHSYDNFKGTILKKRYIDKDILTTDVEALESMRDSAKKAEKFDIFMQLICLVKWDGIEKVDKKYLVNHDNTSYKVDTNKFQYLQQLMGYLCHDYKRRGATDICPIFCDDEAGGSGKGLLFQAIGQMTSVCEIDCKIKIPDHSPENLDKYTRVKVYSDVSKGFDFKSCYNEITEQGTIKHIYKGPISIRYEDMWKVAISSNYIIRGSNPSDLRRQRVFDLFPYFNDKNTVIEKFGHSFFSEDWNIYDWNYFYNRMFGCVQQWLLTGYKIDFKDDSYQSRKINETYPDSFVTFMGTVKRDDFVSTGKIYDDFLTFDYNLNKGVYSKIVHKYVLGNKTYFGRMLKNYLNETGQKYIKTSDRSEIKIYKNENQ